MTVKTRGAILPILLILALVTGCLRGGGDIQSTEPPLTPDTAPPPIYTRTTTPPPVTAQPTTTPPPAVTTTPPPVTTPPTTTTGPPTEEQIKEGIRQDVVGRQFADRYGGHYVVKAGDIKSFEQEILDEKPYWKVKVVASNTTYPYLWFVYYTTSGVFFKAHLLG
ncbi:MAG: hypothetical protein HY555_00910 [Euryarchaeota archaeon]|nr:hypothetical protein [Euryarchaeota archaeon]